MPAGRDSAGPDGEAERAAARVREHPEAPGSTRTHPDAPGARIVEPYGTRTDLQILECGEVPQALLTVA